MDKKKKILALVMAIVGIASVTIGVTYAFLSYTKEGEYENSIKSGSIVFHYNEDSRGLELEDALPLSDVNGKTQNTYFDFSITSKTTSDIAIPYLITARKSGDLDSNIVKVALFTVDKNNNNEEVETELYTSFYDLLGDITKNNNQEKVLYRGTVPINSNNYNQKYRLRMWIDENTDFSPLKDPETGEYIEDEGEYVYPYNGKTFSIQVNVYAEGVLPIAPGINNLTIDGQELSSVNGQSYKYETTISQTSPDVVIDTDVENVNVSFAKMDSTFTNVVAMDDVNIQRMATSTSKLTGLSTGVNYVKITVTNQSNNSLIAELKVKINVESISASDIMVTQGKTLQQALDEIAGMLD